MIQTTLDGLLAVLLVIVFVIAVLFLATGCTPLNPSPAAVVAPTGTDIDQANAYMGSAESAVQAAVPHADAAGQADLGLASSAHKQASASLVKATKDLAGVQNNLAAQGKTISELQGQVASLDASWGHRLQVGVTWAFWIIVSLVAIHLIAGALAIFFPAWGIIPGLISKIVNPFGWFTWLVSHATAPVSAASAAASQAAVTLTRGLSS